MRYIKRLIVIFLFLIIILNQSIGASFDQNDLLKDFIKGKKDLTAKAFYQLNDQIDQDIFYNKLSKEIDSSNWTSFTFISDYTTKPDSLSQEYSLVFKEIMSLIRGKGKKITIYTDLNYRNNILTEFLASNKEASASYLYVEEMEVDEGLDLEIEVPEGEVMSVVAINQETGDYSDLTDLARGQESFPVQTPPKAGSWKILFFLLKDSNNSLDFLSNLYSNVYLDYYFKKNLDFRSELTISTISDIYFSNLGLLLYPAGISWSRDFNEKFELKYGINPSLLYPALLYENEGSAYAKNQLLSFRDELLSEGINKAIKDYTSKYNFLSKASPFLNQTIASQGYMSDLIGFYKNIDIPLFDVMVQSQEAKKYMKLVSSASYNYGKNITSIKLFNPIDTINKSSLYSLTLEAYSKGFNEIYLSSLYANVDSIYNNKLENLDFIPQYNDYVKRVNSLMQKGRAKADIAIIYPIETIYNTFSFQDSEGGNDSLHLDYLDIGDWVFQNLSLDFLYLHPDMIDINSLDDFSLVILPSTDIISLNTLEALDAYYKKGGSIISTGNLPTLTNSEDSEEFKRITDGFFPRSQANEGNYIKTSNKAKGKFLSINPYPFNSDDYKKNIDLLEACINEAIKFRSLSFIDLEQYTNTNLTYSKRTYEDSDIFYIANRGTKAYEGRLVIRGKVDVLILDPHTGAIDQPELRHFKDENINLTSININLNNLESKILVCKDNLLPTNIPLLFTGGLVDFPDQGIDFEEGSISFTFSLKDDSKIILKNGKMTFLELDKSKIQIYQNRTLVKGNDLDLFEDAYYSFNLYLEEGNLHVSISSIYELEVKDYKLEAGNLGFQLTNDSQVLSLNILGSKFEGQRTNDFRTFYLIAVLLILLLRFTKRY